jgi:hypothetical protein
MITAEQAIDKAIEYFKMLPPKLLEGPTNLRLEAIQQHNGEWDIVLSFVTTPSDVPNQFMEALQRQRRYKEFKVDTSSGNVLGMKNAEHD